MKKRNSIPFLMAMMLLLSQLSFASKPIAQISKEEATTIAEDAYIFSLPLLLWEKQFQRITYTTEPKGLMAPMGQFGHARRFVDASNKMVVGFNVDVLYSFAGLDLREEPFVLSVPAIEDRYWIMQIINAWNDVPEAPGSRTHGEKACNFLIAGPNWEGQVPEGMELIRSNTNITCIGGRIYCSGEEADYAIVNALQDQVTLTPLSAWGTDFTPPANVPLADIEFPVDVNQAVLSMDVETYFNNTNRILAGSETYKADAPILAQMKKIGLEAGKEFSLDNFDAEVAVGIKAGFAQGHKRLMEIAENLGVIKNGWTVTYEMGRYGADYDLRAGWSYLGLGGNLIEDAFYPLTRVDQNDDELHGDHKYVLTFENGNMPPENAFWSLTMYDADAYLVENPLDRYALSNKTDLKYEADGSLKIYFQHERPSEDKVANWLPAPEGTFMMTLRVYAPKENAQNGEWIPPVVEKQ
ncbi:DUF1254 domain-containing protein [Sediminitomix flava]|uniref:DNA sulfur modification protein DndE n=1 Tax=Sediminitomix flava TaxID=379075 RepID=A0A315ZAA1_SEDFL|nr:DUF1254 domain-containing protein [Sediminitomix flava]PWJ41768.1 DNA sulfur modification protein DndE [Sediminitomix flava]